MNKTKKKSLAPLYYISQGETAEQHLQNIQKVCEGGVRLVQLRLKNCTEQEYLNIAKQAKEICNQFNATLIINDSIAVAKAVNAGLHLGQQDETIAKAKSVLKNQLIGATANTLEQCLELIHQQVDYIGLGPFRFTTTKKNLSPILGVEGYRNIIEALKKRGYHVPIYAIGGIVESDIEILFHTGIYGIAVSGFLTAANSSEIEKINKKINLN